MALLKSKLGKSYPCTAVLNNKFWLIFKRLEVSDFMLLIFNQIFKHIDVWHIDVYPLMLLPI